MCTVLIRTATQHTTPAKFSTVRYPEAPIFAIGYSLGANLLVKYLGEEGRNGYRPLAGAVSVSNPWNFENNTVGSGKAKSFVATAMGKVYSLALTTGLKVSLVFVCVCVFVCVGSFLERASSSTLCCQETQVCFVLLLLFVLCVVVLALFVGGIDGAPPAGENENVCMYG